MARGILRKDQRVALLSGVALFSGCSRAELGKVASLTTEHRAQPGQVLATSGEAGEEFFVIIEGQATATRRDLHLATLGPGSFFGELALLDGGKRTATVVADTDMRLLVLSRREFDSLRYAAPSVAYKMLEELGARLRRATDMLDRGVALGHNIEPWSL